MNLNPIKVYGGPGCGKTSYLLDILDGLLTHTKPDRIAYVSFTNKGADAGTNRARAKYGLDKKDTPYWDTIHAIANRAACSGKGKVISTDNYRVFSLATQMRFLGYFTEELNHGDDIYLFMEQLHRTNNLKHDMTVGTIPDIDKYNWVINQYNLYKKVYQVYDFTDMLETYLNANIPLDIDYMIVDEAQDLTPLQWKVIEVMARDCKETYIAGDDDQAIYEWCGGDVTIFNSIPAKDVIVLDKSYRVCSEALKLSSKIANLIQDRQEKNITPVQEHPGHVSIYGSLESVEIDHESSYYFLARNRHFLPQVKNKIMRLGYPFTMRGIIYPRKISGKNKTRISNREYLYSQRMKDKGYHRNISANRLIVDTIHRVKGGEADQVVLLLDCTQVVKRNLVANLYEEIRVLYVAMTRCRYHLHIVLSQATLGYDSIVSRAHFSDRYVA